MARFAFGVPLVLLASIAAAQNHTQSNPQAVSLASQPISLDSHKRLSVWPSLLINWALE